jgi:hypothetical protein
VIEDIIKYVLAAIDLVATSCMHWDSDECSVFCVQVSDAVAVVLCPSSLQLQSVGEKEICAAAAAARICMRRPDRSRELHV